MLLLLLLSNSTIAGREYFSFVKQHINNFLGKQDGKGCFIPYAGVSITYDKYFELVRDNLQEFNYQIESVHKTQNPTDLVNESDFILVGGGNTFHLLKELQTNNLIDTIRNRVLNGMPYVGWSAGSNICCPTICTTNDMPIVFPESFEALNLIPFQINPHYTNAQIPNHAGETRDARIEEYIEINKGTIVAGLPENSFFEIKGADIRYSGEKACRIFRYGNQYSDLIQTNDFGFLMK